MKGTGALQMIFAFFLGLVVVAFVGIGVNTFYPAPEWDSDGSLGSRWQLLTGIILLVIATVLLAISLALPDEQAVISNGILLGGAGTMLYAVIMTLSASNSLWRFVVAAIALAVTVVIGYLKFARRPPSSPEPAPAAAPATWQPAPSTDFAPAADGDLAERLVAVEQKLDALARALRA